MRVFTLIFGVLAVPFVWTVARNVAVPLRFEDALIVLRYARNLAEGHGFVFNPGERVLGVTTPLHTLASAGYVSLGPQHAPAIQNVSGLVFLVLEAWLAARLVQRTHPPPVGGLVAVLVATNLNFSYLYFGMETHLFAFLVLLAFTLHTSRRETATGIVLGLAFLTRYDAALLALLIGLALWAERRTPPWRLAAAFFAVTTPWLVFAALYFGTILPSPLGAKHGYYPALGYLRDVFRYYQDTFGAVAGVFTSSEAVRAAAAWLFPAFCAAGTWSLAKAARDWLVLIAFAALQVLVYAAVGPDPGFTWHYYLLNPVLLILFVVGLYETAAAAVRGGARLARRGAGRRGAGRRGAGRRDAAFSRGALTFLTLAAVALAAVNLYRSVGHRFQLDPHSRQMYRIAEWLDARYGAETSLLQPSIGILGYATRLRLIDHAGLVTPGLYYYDSSRHTPMPEVLERFRPDLVLVPEDAAEAPEAHGYRLVTTFRDPVTYRLFERGAAGAESAML